MKKNKAGTFVNLLNKIIKYDENGRITDESWNEWYYVYTTMITTITNNERQTQNE